MACDLSILVDVDILTEVISVACAGIDGEVIPGNFDDLAVFRFALFNDSRLHAVHDFRVVEDGDRKRVPSVREAQLISRFENGMCLCQYRSGTYSD